MWTLTPLYNISELNNYYNQHLSSSTGSWVWVLESSSSSPSDSQCTESSNNNSWLTFPVFGARAFSTVPIQMKINQTFDIPVNSGLIFLMIFMEHLWPTSTFCALLWSSMQKSLFDQNPVIWTWTKPNTVQWDEIKKIIQHSVKWINLLKERQFLKV